MDLNLNFCECGTKKSYSQLYDAYYCDPCNKWLEPSCGDKNCEFCANRPELPNQTVFQVPPLGSGDLETKL
jgi:hypothetical protein